MIPHSYTFSHGLCLNNFPHVWLIGNQRDQVTPFRYINWAYEFYHFSEKVKCYDIRNIY